MIETMNVNIVSRLSHLVTPPSVVREIDWINVHWPDNVPEDR